MIRKGRFILFTEEEERIIVARLQSGETKLSIAKQYGIKPKPLDRIVRKYGVDLHAIQHVLLEDGVIKEIIGLYTTTNISIINLGRRYHVWPPRLREALVKHGVTIRPRKTTPDRTEAIAYDYVHGGLNTEDICRKHGVTEKVVRRIVRERGLIRKVVPIVTTARQRCGNKGFYQLWIERYGQEEANKRMNAFKDQCGRRCKGSGNPMYGKNAPSGSGTGWKGWYKDIFFRSLRELCFLIDQLDKPGVQWENGEGGDYRVKYVDYEGCERTYCPDYVILSAKTMVEIKPKKLWGTPAVLAKAEAGQRKCTELGLKYILIDPPIEQETILKAYKAGFIKWMDKSLPRFEAYYKLAKAVA